MNLNEIEHFEYGKGIRFFINDIKCGSIDTTKGVQDVVDLLVMLTDPTGNHLEVEVRIFKDTNEGSSYASLLEGFARAYPDKVRDDHIDESDMKGTSGICDAWLDKKSYRHLNNFLFDTPAPTYAGEEEGDI